MSQVLLLSGGMDSIALAAWKRPAHAITIDYGQRPALGEIRAAQVICNQFKMEHHVLQIDCSFLGSGDLAGAPALKVAPVREWWPYRNQLLLTLGAMKAISLNASSLLIGSVKTDGEHIDGTSEFYAGMDAIVSMQEGNIKIEVPAIEMTTTQLIAISRIDPDILCWSHSCHTGEYSCGTCRGCIKNRGVKAELGIHDRVTKVP